MPSPCHKSADEDEVVAHKATMDSILSKINIMVDIHKEGDDGYLWGGKQYNVSTTLIDQPSLLTNQRKLHEIFVDRD